MSWAEEDWTVGLSGKVLHKVKELQVHHERLSRENKQKQLLLDNIQTSLEKQTAKYEEVRAELQSSHRELQRVQDQAKVAVTTKERLTQDLQSKQAQVCSLEGQLDAARTHNNKLTQEVKRLEAELEKLQNSSRSAETTLFSTPCWSTTSPWELSGSRKDERHGNREEGTQGLHVRRLQFSDMPSSSLPRQQTKSTHQHHPPDVFSTPSAAFPWERDDSKPTARRPSPVSPKTPYGDALSQSQLEQDLCVKASSPSDTALQLQHKLTDLEEELRLKAETLNSIQNEVAQNKKELAAKEINLQRLRDELSLAHTRMCQEGDRASVAEHKAKQLQEELKCQRQNAESSRVQHQQRTKELEKQHQRDLQDLQKERQHMERQHQQDINKLSQELAQARTLHNSLQAQLDKMSLQKHELEKEMDALNQKLKWTEGQLHQSQKNVAQTQDKLKDALQEAEALTVSLKLSQKKERDLEEDKRRLTEERNNTQILLKELQAQNASSVPLPQTPQIYSTTQTSSPKPSVSHSSQPLHKTQRPNLTNPAKQKREEMNRRGEFMAPYPSDREPGEGIDSEQINDNLSGKSESLQKEEPGNVQDTDSLQTSPENTLTLRSKQVVVSDDLQAENAALRSELCDVREELQKRLDDLEAQRRAETEARTRLKQLSRKNANQVTEKEEQYKECKAQLEKEKSEVDRLNKALAVLETQIMREREEKVDKSNMPKDTEDEMIEFNIQLTKQLSEVKAQLALEREEKKQQKEEMMTNTSSDTELKKRIEELEDELEQLKTSRNNNSQVEEELSAASSPLTYFTLQEDKLNSNVVDETDKAEDLSFCQSTNQLNTKLSQASGDYIQPEEILIEQCKDEQAEKEQTLRTSLCQAQEVSDLQLLDLQTQVQWLQQQNAIEKECATQYQIKLEALQNQVTKQTQQLTEAFEKQSLHISGLLLELQDRENALLSTEQELQQYKQELSALKAELNEESETKEENDDTELQLTSDAESPVFSPMAEIRSAEVSDSINQQELNFSEDGEMNSESKDTADISAEMLSLQQQNHLLKLKLKALTVPKPLGINTDVLPLDKLTATAVSDINVQACTETQQSSVSSSEHEHGKEDEEQLGAVSQRLDQIGYLQQQVVALQTKLQALSQENQQKTQELTLWRLASESVPKYVQSPAPAESDTSDHTEGLNSNLLNKDESGQAALQKTHEGSGCVTLVREDELLLSCSSTKLQGRTLFSRLQHSVISEQSTPHSFTPSLQEHFKDQSESEKENTWPTQHNQKKDTERVTKDVHRGLGLQLTDVLDCPLVNIASAVKPISFSKNRGVEVYLKCVSTQTESLPEPPELQCTHTQTELREEGEDLADSTFVARGLLGAGHQSKDKMMTGSFPIPSDPASLAERIRRNRTQLSAAFDDTEYEPYGLPEVVMKGFADIPSGPSCPYIVRRGLLGTAAVPVPSKNMEEVEETD